MSPDLHTLTGAYAADALDPVEREDFEQHLAACPSCAQEVLELQATTARLGASVIPVSVSDDFRARVLRQAAATRQIPPVVSSLAAARPARRPWYSTPLTGVAAALVAVCIGLGGYAVDQHNQASRLQADAQIVKVVSDPSHVTATATGAAGAAGTVYRLGGRAVFLAHGMPALDASHTYQLWLIGPDGVTSAGLLSSASDARAFVADVGNATSLGVSVEPKGGSTKPTTTPNLVVPLTA